MLGSALVLLLVGASPSPRQSLPPTDPAAALVELPGMERYKKLLTENEPKGLWKKIHWLTLDQTQLQARENRKPILLTIKTGSMGKANSPFT